MRILLTILFVLCSTVAYADMYRVKALTMWNVDGKYQQIEICKNYSPCEYDTVVTHGDETDRATTVNIYTDEVELAKMKADGYPIIYAEKLNADKTDIEPTYVYACTDDKIDNQSECEKKCETIGIGIDAVEVCEEWYLKETIPYPQPEGKDKATSLADTVSINNYLGTSLNLSGKTKEEATEILIDEVKGFKKKAVVVVEP